MADRTAFWREMRKGVDKPGGFVYGLSVPANVSWHDPGPSRVWDGYGVAAGPATSGERVSPRDEGRWVP